MYISNFTFAIKHYCCRLNIALHGVLHPPLPSCFVAHSASLHQVFSSCKKRIGFIFSAPPTPMASLSWIWYSSSKLLSEYWLICISSIWPKIKTSAALPFNSITYPNYTEWSLPKLSRIWHLEVFWNSMGGKFRKGGKICTTVVICQRQPAFTSKSYFIPVVKCHGPCFSTCFSLS